MSKIRGYLPDQLPDPLEYILDPMSRPAIRTVDRISLLRKMHGCTAVCTTNFLNDHSTFFHVVLEKTKVHDHLHSLLLLKLQDGEFSLGSAFHHILLKGSEFLLGHVLSVLQYSRKSWILASLGIKADNVDAFVVISNGHMRDWVYIKRYVADFFQGSPESYGILIFSRGGHPV